MQENPPHAGNRKPTAKHYPDVLSFTQLHVHGEVSVVFLARDVADAVMAAAGGRLAAAIGAQQSFHWKRLGAKNDYIEDFEPLVYTTADTSGSLTLSSYLN